MVPLEARETIELDYGLYVRQRLKQCAFGGDGGIELRRCYRARGFVWVFSAGKQR